MTDDDTGSLGTPTLARVTGRKMKRVAVEASALLRESLKAALSAKGFSVESSADQSQLTNPADAVVFEVTEQSEARAASLLSQLPKTTFILIGPIAPEAASGHRNIRELSADVSVAEVVRVCQQALFGAVPASVPRPSASQTSGPFNVLRRPTEPPPSLSGPSASSSPAPLVPPPSAPNPQVARPLPPVASPSSSRAESKVAPGQQVPTLSTEFEQLLSQAERRVAQQLKARPPTASAAREGPQSAPVLDLTEEMLSALDDPIGDYDEGDGSLYPPVSSVPPVRFGSSAPQSPPLQSCSSRVASSQPPRQSQSARGSLPQATTSSSSAQETPKPASVATPEPPSPPVVPSNGAERGQHAPHTRRTPTRSLPPPSSSPSLSSPDQSAASGRLELRAEPTTDRTQAGPSFDEVVASPHPASQASAGSLSRLPRDPLVPRGVWVNPPTNSERPESVSKTKVPTDRPPPNPSAPLRTPSVSPTNNADSYQVAKSGEPESSPPNSEGASRRAPTIAPTPRPLAGEAAAITSAPPRRSAPVVSSTSAPPKQAESAAATPPAASQSPAGPSVRQAAASDRTDPPSASLSRSTEQHPLAAVEVPPLKPGDGVTVLARAIRERFTGVVTYEADDGIRRIVLREGDFVTAASSVRAESLLAFLSKRGHLSAEISSQLEHKLPAFGRHTGAALIASGHLAQEQLWPVLRAHAEFVTGQALGLERGIAAYESTVPERLMAEPSVFGGATGSEVLVEIVRRVVPPTDAIRRLGGDQVELLSGPHHELIDECALTPDEQDALDRALDLPLGRALADAPNEAFACVLLVLQVLGVILRRPGSGTQDSSTPAVASDALDVQALRQAILNRKSLVDNGDYFSVLGVSRSATGYDIRRAYVDLKRQFDPAVALTASTIDLSDSVDAIHLVLDEAYEILHDQMRRDRYRRAIEAAPLG